MFIKHVFIRYKIAELVIPIILMGDVFEWVDIILRCSIYNVHSVVTFLNGFDVSLLARSINLSVSSYSQLQLYISTIEVHVFMQE